MTVHAIKLADDAQIAVCVATWQAQKAVVGNLNPDFPYAVWTAQSARDFLANADAAFMDDITGTFCVLTLDPENGEYELVPGIKAGSLSAFGACFHACAALLPPPTSQIIRGSSPVGTPATIVNFLTTRFPNPVIAGGVITWRATIAQVLGKV